MPVSWSVHHFIEYLSELSGQGNEAQAIAVAAERAAEALDAEVAAVVVEGETRYCIGFGTDTPPESLIPTARAGGALVVPRIGTLHAFAAAFGRDINGLLVVARCDEPLVAQEFQMLHGMARTLGLAIQGIRALEAERALRETRESEAQQRLELLEAVRTRQRLMETLLNIQRTISSRKPLQDIFETITTGASKLVHGVGVALVLTDSEGQGPPIIISRSGAQTCDDDALRRRASEVMCQRRAVCHPSAPESDHLLIAEPVHVEEEVVGSLVADVPTARGDAPEWRSLLATFAQQVTIALADARTVAAMREAFHDPLTGLANRALLLNALTQAIDSSRPDTSLTVVYIDLDGFKAINDSAGHQAGDELLQRVAGRVTRCLRPGDLAARVGGDEFVLMLSHSDQSRGVAVAERVIAAVKQPFYIAGREMFVAASAGVVERWPHCSEASELLSTGDIAMYHAKRQGRGRVVVFEPGMRASIRERMELQGELRRASDFQDFSLRYQPIVSLTTGQPIGVEALVRWDHPTRGPVPPSEFIAVAEETGTIRDLGRWVLEQSVQQVSEWRQTIPHLRLNVNVSARQIGFRRFPAEVAEILTHAKLPSHCLTVELTETALLIDPQSALSQLEELRELGVQISVDDFGTGYSSLSHLRNFPVDEVKIDRTFVAYMDRSPADFTLVRAIVDLGRSLRLQTVAEGIENHRQLATLRRLGCGLGQGYLLARPLHPRDVRPFFQPM